LLTSFSFSLPFTQPCATSISGLTNNGKQRTPDWLSDLLGVERAPPESEDTLTLKKLFGGQLPE
jgi:hypothetical protein